jgi:hypothetical protein
MTLEPKRVIFTGQTGIAKVECLQRLASYVLKKEGVEKTWNDPDSLRMVTIIDFEKELQNLMSFDNIAPFLDLEDAREQERIWAQTFDHVIERLREAKPKHVFLSMHASNFRRSRFFPPLDVGKLRSFQPDAIITLIDDIPRIMTRINHREMDGSPTTGTNLRLKELVTWRSVEILLSDIIARNVPIAEASKPLRNYVVAVNHPISMLFRLLYHKGVIVYASYPITATRGNPEARKEIDDFRQKLQANYVMFDPLTIDERVLQLKLEQAFPESKRNPEAEVSGGITIDMEDRWPIRSDNTLAPPDTDIWPLKVSAEEVKEVAKDIDNNIRTRDYRLIADSNVTVGYRPHYRGRESQGVVNEINHSVNMAKHPTLVFWPTKDGNRSDFPFALYGTTFDDLDKLFADLEARDQKRKVSRSLK